jgi:xylulokinase
MSSQTTASPLFLGLDLSTQQLKAVLIKEDATIVHEASVHFSNDLSHFNTTNGTYHGPGEGEVTSPVAMWLEAIDLLFERMSKEDVSFSDILAISGAGQVSLRSEISAHLRLIRSVATRLSVLVDQSRIIALQPRSYQEFD